MACPATLSVLFYPPPIAKLLWVGNARLCVNDPHAFVCIHQVFDFLERDDLLRVGAVCRASLLLSEVRHAVLIISGRE
jgi:hypothetical protein